MSTDTPAPVPSDPPLSMLRERIALARKNKMDLIIMTLDESDALLSEVVGMQTDLKAVMEESGVEEIVRCLRKDCGQVNVGMVDVCDNCGYCSDHCTCSDECRKCEGFGVTDDSGTTCPDCENGYVRRNPR